MKPEIRDQWADALESGEYKQGRGALTTVLADGTEEDCCLGVLCKLAVKAGVIPEPEAVIGRTKAYGATVETGLLPEEVQHWAETGHSTVTFIHEGMDRFAESLNDTLELSFTDIAKLIREQL